MISARTIISGTGSCIPSELISNSHFSQHSFYLENSTRIEVPPTEIIDKFQKITGISERRYAGKSNTTSDLATIAGRDAIKDSKIDPESIDQLIVAHNFGNVIKDTNQIDAVPALACRVKHNLGIQNPNCVAYDLLFGCPGWLQGVIQADAFFKAGIAKKALVIGAETLSRVIDEYDRDSMIFSDGAGACVLEFKESGTSGILSTSAVTHAIEELNYINMGKSYFPGSDPNIKFIKMKGRKVYEYAVKNVAQAMKDCFDKTGLSIKQLSKIFIHQANEKMDEAIVREFYKLYNISEAPSNIMPMTIHWLGNSSVATIPTLFDLVLKGKVEEHDVNKGDLILFASVGAGMNINAVCYRI